MVAAIGFFDLLELGLAMPVTLDQSSGKSTSSLNPPGLDAVVAGDLRIYPKWRILDHEGDGAGLALLAVVTVPSGSAANLQGSGAVTIEPRLTFEYAVSDRLRAGLSAGYLIRTARSQCACQPPSIQKLGTAVWRADTT